MTAMVESQVTALKPWSHQTSHFEGGADTESPEKTTLTNFLLAMQFHL